MQACKVTVHASVEVIPFSQKPALKKIDRPKENKRNQAFRPQPQSGPVMQLTVCVGVALSTWRTVEARGVRQGWCYSNDVWHFTKHTACSFRDGWSAGLWRWMFSSAHQTQNLTNVSISRHVFLCFWWLLSLPSGHRETAASTCFFR